MRPVLLGDVVAAARALRAVDEEDRPALLSRLLSQAGEAERHGRETGRNHPVYGDGSLMTVALGHCRVAEPSLEDGDYCACLALVLTRLALRQDHPRVPKA
jgi:class 3 adenylate cyclase